VINNNINIRAAPCAGIIVCFERGFSSTLCYPSRKTKSRRALILGRYLIFWFVIRVSLPLADRNIRHYRRIRAAPYPSNFTRPAAVDFFTSIE
jgi:hypothetical protein